MCRRQSITDRHAAQSDRKEPTVLIASRRVGWIDWRRDLVRSVFSTAGSRVFFFSSMGAAQRKGKIRGEKVAGVEGMHARCLETGVRCEGGQGKGTKTEGDKVRAGSRDFDNDGKATTEFLWRVGGLLLRKGKWRFARLYAPCADAKKSNTLSRLVAADSSARYLPT